MTGFPSSLRFSTNVRVHYPIMGVSVPDNYDGPEELWDENDYGVWRIYLTEDIACIPIASNTDMLECMREAMAALTVADLSNRRYSTG